MVWCGFGHMSKHARQLYKMYDRTIHYYNSIFIGKKKLSFFFSAVDVVALYYSIAYITQNARSIESDR